MRISDKLAKSLLLKSGKFTDKQLDELRSLSTKTHRPLQDLIITTGLLSETELTQLYGEQLDLPFVELVPERINHKAFNHLPEHVANRYKAVVFDIDEQDGEVLVAMENPDDSSATSFLKKQLGDNLKLHVTTEAHMQTALDQYRSSARPTQVLTILGYAPQSEDLPAIRSKELTSSAAARDSLNQILESAIAVHASDIHIEPQADHVAIRYRVDGMLQQAHKLPTLAHGPLLDHIKVTGQLKSSGYHSPDYGYWKMQTDDQHYRVRASVMPTIDGEKAVLHISHEPHHPPSLRELGLWGTSLSATQKVITELHGSIFVTGPIGSGKSTTLFSLLSILSSPNISVATVEDPLEYRIAGANQFQINPGSGITFQSAVKALLRQDPNIIMVSELQDNALADLLIKTSLKGHLVLSSLHSPSTAAALKRLIDMHVEPYMVADSVRIIIGQRLARKLCPACREAITPNKTLLGQVERLVHIETSSGFKRIHELEKLAVEESLGLLPATQSSSQLGSTSRGISRLWQPRAGGCNHCNHSGYRGRVGIFEVLTNTSEVQKVINRTGSSVKAIQKAATDTGMVSLQLDGLIKALRGETSVAEVVRVASHG